MIHGTLCIWFGKCAILEILNITFKYLLEFTSTAMENGYRSSEFSHGTGDFPQCGYNNSINHPCLGMVNIPTIYGDDWGMVDCYTHMT